MSKKILRRVWSVDNDPADVLRSDAISMSSETTCLTAEAFTLTVSFGDVPATWAGSARISWVNVDYGDAFNFGFVLDEALKLVETPRVDCSPLVATLNSYSQSDSLDVFEGYASKSVLSLLNNPFRDCMVDCRGESVFLFVSFFEQTLRRFSSYTLEFTSDFGVSASYSVEFFSNPSFAVAVSSYVLNANIYSEKIFWSERFCFWNFDCCGKIELLISENEVCLSSDFVESGFLIVAYQHGDFLSTLQREYTYGFKSFPTEYALVINHCTMQAERGFDGFAGFVGICNFAYGSDCHLRGKLEFLSHLTVDKSLKLPIVKSLSLKSGFGDAVASIVESFHSFFEQNKLCFVGSKLNQERLLHNCIDCNRLYLSVFQFLPCLKTGASLERR